MTITTTYTKKLTDPAATRSAYGYANGGPLNGTDPSGLSSCAEPDNAWDVVGSIVDCAANADPQDAVDGIREVIEQGPVESYKTGAEGVYRAPDYVVVDASFFVPGLGGGFNITVTRSGHVYFGLSLDPPMGWWFEGSRIRGKASLGWDDDGV